MDKAVLWTNVQALMRKHYGGENLSRLSRECDVGLGTSARIKRRQTSVGIDILARIAERFDLQPWQLLVPGFDPDNPPYSSPRQRSGATAIREAVRRSKIVQVHPRPILYIHT